MLKLTDRCFCRFTAAMLVPLGRAPTWRFHTKLYKFGWSTFPNNARMKNRTELNLGKVFYVWLIYHIQDSWLNSLNGYDIYFWLRDTANQPFFPSTVGRSLKFVAVKNLVKNLELKTTTINEPRGELITLHSVKSQRMYLLIRLESNTSYVRPQR